jgi:hypothetical protein
MGLVVVVVVVDVVEVVNDDSYVTNYSVAYKDSQTQKWVHYNEFEGNINSYTAKINPVDIYSRYIRIKHSKKTIYRSW